MAPLGHTLLIGRVLRFSLEDLHDTMNSVQVKTLARRPNMEKPKAQPIVGVLLTALTVLLIVGVATFAGPCDDHGNQGEMSCLWASRAVLGIGAVTAVLAIVRIFETDEGERRGLSLSCGLLGFLMAAIPGPIISLCADSSMHCNAIMRPFMLVVGIAIGVIGAVDLVRRLLSIRKRNRSRV